MSASTHLALTVLKGSGQGRKVELDGAIAVGSSRTSDLHLRDASVSWNHARLWTENGQCFVEDLGSANGTRVNGDTVQKCAIKPGDLLAIGNTVLGLHVGDDPAPSMGDVVNGHAQRGSGPPKKRLSVLDQLDLAKAESQRWKARVDEMEAEKQELSSQLSTVKARESKFKKKVGELEKKTQSTDAGKKELYAELESLRSGKTKGEKELARLTRKVESLTSELAEKRIAAEEKLHGEVEARKAAESEVKANRSRLSAALESAEEEKRVRLSQEAETVQLRKVAEKAAQEEKVLRESIIALERSQMTTSVETLALKGAVERFEAERKQYEMAALEAAKQLEAARESSEIQLSKARSAQDAEARSYREEIEAMGREHRKEIRDIEERSAQSIAKKEDEFESLLENALSRERELVRREIDWSGGQLNQLVNELEKLRDERQGLTQELHQKIRGITRLEESLRLKSAECESQTRILDEKNSRISGLESELSGLREEISASRKSAAASEERAVVAEQTLYVESERSKEIAERLEKIRLESEELREKNQELEESRKEAVSVGSARDAELRSEIEELQSQLVTAERLYREEQRKGDDLVSEKARLETELGLVRGYVREIKDKLRDRDRDTQELQARLRDRASADKESRS